MPHRLRLLVIDDDVVDRLAVRRAIEQGGVGDVEEAANADEAIAKVGRETYDCLLLGQDLPGMSGIDLAKRVRESGNGVSIVFVTGQQDEELLEQAADAGINDFIAKTELSPRRLAHRIKFAIRVGAAEAEAARLLERANTAARARDEVLAIVSHDLRSPLHAISLACEALRDETTETATRYLGAIERAVHRAERLISDLLEVSEIENEALQLTQSSFDAVSLVRQAAADHELLARESGARIATRTPDAPVVVRADRERLLQVFGNLIGNALKHAKGTALELTLERREHGAVFGVRDHGPGITPVELPHIFDRYWTGRTKRGGAGLGLAIARGLVIAQGGKIWVESEPGNGTQFWFSIPFA